MQFRYHGISQVSCDSQVLSCALVAHRIKLFSIVIIPSAFALNIIELQDQQKVLKARSYK